MANCPRCGAVNRDEATFCKDCGNTLAAPADVSFASVTTAHTALCPKCGAPLGPDAAFCGNCGATLTAAAPPPPPPPPPASAIRSSAIPLPPDPGMAPLGAPPSGAGRNIAIILVIAFALGILGGAGYYAYKHYLPHRAQPGVTADSGVEQPVAPPPAASAEIPTTPPSVPFENPPAAPTETPLAPPGPPATAPRPAATPARPRPASTPLSGAPLSPPPASSPQPPETAPAPTTAAPEPPQAAPPQPPPPETPPRAQPAETVRPAPPVAPPARPAPVVPARPAYNGPASGVLIWTGQLDKEGSVTIDGGTASAGSLQGVLPGVPISIEVDTKDIGMTESPRASNGWKKLTLRSHKKRSGPITIRWKVLN